MINHYTIYFKLGLPLNSTFFTASKHKGPSWTVLDFSVDILLTTETQVNSCCTCMLLNGFHFFYLILIIYRILLPVELERARTNFLIKSANRNVELTQTSPTSFYAKFLTPLGTNDLLFLGATVGEKVIFKKWSQKEELFVSSLDKERGLKLEYPDKSGFTNQTEQNFGPPPESFIFDANNLNLHAHFTMSNFKYRLLETGAIDGLTALGGRWFFGENISKIGTPMVITKIQSVQLVAYRDNTLV
jgi:hypothetical protein